MLREVSKERNAGERAGIDYQNDNRPRDAGTCQSGVNDDSFLESFRMNYITLQTVIGKIGLAEEQSQLVHVFLANQQPPVEARKSATPFLADVAEQFKRYFEGRCRKFNIAILLTGTPFQTAVWDALLTIPFGETRSYKDIAAQIGKPASCRAVGGAVHVNPLPIIVPCHRVIGSDGSLTGYAGGLDVKKTLLEREQRFAIH
jgi:methylated-DNA-[protein]-cysteine S-methyltransferase